MAALMQEVVDHVHAIEEHAPEERIVYVEIADDLTDEERAEMAAMRKEHAEHPENFISLKDLMAENGITKEDLAKVPHARFVYNI